MRPLKARTVVAASAVAVTAAAAAAIVANEHTLVRRNYNTSPISIISLCAWEEGEGKARS